MSPADTIVAVATPSGEGAIAIVRVSGSSALSVVAKCFVPSRRGIDLTQAATHTILHGHFSNGVRCLDEVLVSIFRAPKSYTCEDLVEIGCHGGVLITRGVLEALIVNGARAAIPGEFTRRAFLNGRLDLTQAEAVGDLIRARSEVAAQVALGQLQGRLTTSVAEARSELIDVAAHIEAQLDFPDSDLDPDQGERMVERLNLAQGKILSLLRTARDGRVLRDGFRVALVGRPNAGKSSLMNALLGEDRAIVTSNPGTTRDTLEEILDLEGWPIVLIDTAGWREAEDEAEKEGIKRAYKVGKAADLILHLVDATIGWQESDEALSDQFPNQSKQVVWNKSDLIPAEATFEIAGTRISCRTGSGLDVLRKELLSSASSVSRADEGGMVAINARQAGGLRRASEAVGRATQGLLAGVALDLVSLDVAEAIGATGDFLGESVSEAVLDREYQTFCIGK
jgi:tRNA modification GTPase